MWRQSDNTLLYTSLYINCTLIVYIHYLSFVERRCCMIFVNRDYKCLRWTSILIWIQYPQHIHPGPILPTYLDKQSHSVLCKYTIQYDYTVCTPRGSTLYCVYSLIGDLLLLFNFHFSEKYYSNTTPYEEMQRQANVYESMNGLMWHDFTM